MLEDIPQMRLEVFGNGMEVLGRKLVVMLHLRHRLALLLGTVSQVIYMQEEELQMIVEGYGSGMVAVGLSLVEILLLLIN